MSAQDQQCRTCAALLGFTPTHRVATAGRMTVTACTLKCVCAHSHGALPRTTYAGTQCYTCLRLSRTRHSKRASSTRHTGMSGV
jgi:hypothetical protein